MSSPDPSSVSRRGVARSPVFAEGRYVGSRRIPLAFGLTGSNRYDITQLIQLMYIY
jgi:hypothetical protein